MIHNVCLILGKCLDYTNVRLFDDPSNRVVLDLTLLMLQQWISEQVEHDAFILGSVVELVEMLIHSAQFWQAFKVMPCMAKMLALSKRPQISAFIKTKIVSIVAALSKQSHNLIVPPVGNASQAHRAMVDQDVKSKFPNPYDA